ncbi:transmembrane protease serine 3 isoform X2 [Nerophis ophidion]|uniref:transmembrane protease serine 3 isoform X2 n=1 Tax=Nerophis ophidion TaxID=159077 RepID=UPI002ADF7A77|nr:transmembrane protease serine 3 isoform X2 [Nerophis ophidion]
MSIHPFSTAYSLSGSRGALAPISATIGRKAGYTLDKSPPHRRAANVFLVKCMKTNMEAGQIRCQNQRLSCGIRQKRGTFFLLHLKTWTSDSNQCKSSGSVRVSGRSSVLQVQREGVWKTVCSEDWNNLLGVSACKQLGYNSYVESFFIPLTSIEQNLQYNLVSISLSHNLSQSQTIQLQNATTFSKTQCTSGRVTTLKCLECGFRPKYTMTRIVGGNISRPGQFPWQVSLHFNSEHLCGGSIVTSFWIVTAAHCLFGFTNQSMWRVHVGQTEQPVHGAQSLAVEKMIFHARYRPKGLDYDIALMKLSKPLDFDGFVEPICLPNYGEEFEQGTECWISGWGATEDEGETSVFLRSAMVPILSTKTCNQPEVYQGLISPWMVCAGYLEGGTDSCQGDSGGPLACEDSSLWKLVGATSWGIGCAVRNKPGVYTRITRSLSWIRQHMEVSP